MRAAAPIEFGIADPGLTLKYDGKERANKAEGTEGRSAIHILVNARLAKFVVGVIVLHR
jgi:hypothetical protein